MNCSTRPRLHIYACTLLAGICSQAHAETAFAVYTGTSDTRSSDLRVSQPNSRSDATFGDVTWHAKPFDDAPYYGVRMSYRPRRLSHVGIGADFTHYKMHADTDRSASVRGTWNAAPVDTSEPIQTRVSDLQISHGVNLTSLNVEYHFFGPNDSLKSRWQPYVGAGVVAYLPHAEGTINGVSTSGDYQLAGWGYQLFAGAEYRISRHFGALLQAKYDDGTLGIDMTPDTRIETDVRTVHALIGLVWFP